MTFPDGPYVYVLVDEFGAPFYVGKGRRRRALSHLRDATRGAKGARFDAIRDLLARGCEYRFEIVSTHETDDEAARSERELIEALPGLTNMTGGGEIGNVLPPKEILSKRARALLSRVVSDGLGESPLADAVRKEAECASPNVAEWSPETGVVLGWHTDRSPGLPETLRGFHGA